MNLLEKIKCKLQGVREVEDIPSVKELKEVNLSAQPIQNEVD